MIEFKNLHDRYIMQQAFIAAAAAAAINFNNSNSSTDSDTSQNTSLVNAFLNNHLLQQQQQQDDLSASSYTNSSPATSSTSSPKHKHHCSDSESEHKHKRPLIDFDLNNAKRFKVDTCAQKRKYSDEYTENKCHSNKKSSSFLISDILGLDSTAQKQEESSKLMEQYQTQLKQSYYSAFATTNSDFYRLITETKQKSQEKTPAVSPILAVQTVQPRTEITVSPISHKTTESKTKNSILSSLEQLTKDQFQDDLSIKSRCLNSSSSKKDTVKKPESDILTRDQDTKNEVPTKNNPNGLPAWVFCTRYSDRPSAGPRHRKKSKTKVVNTTTTPTNNIKVKTECIIQQSTTGLSSTSITNKTDTTNTNLSKQTNLSYSSSSSNSSFSYSPSTTTTTTTTQTNKLKNETQKLEQECKQASDYENNDEERFYDDDDEDDDSNSSSSKRPRTAFTSSQLNRLKNEFEKCKYLTGEKRQYLANELQLNESQIKIWFQNKRAKIKKSSGVKNNLALQLMAQGLYNHGSGVNQSIDD